MHKTALFVFIIVVGFAAPSCYRMPEDGEVSTLPTTNNPSITRQQNASIPGIPNR